MVALICLGMAFGAPWISIVGLTSIAQEMGGSRSVPALAGSLVWLGSAVGGILMGPLAARFGVRATVIGGALSVAVGLVISTGGESWHLYLGHGLFIGLLGTAGLNAPLYIYVSRWFDKRRGSALALISSGAYVAGFVWPTFFERGIAMGGWRWTMLVYSGIVVAVIVPLALFVFREPPEAPPPPVSHASGGRAAPCSAGRRTWCSR